MRSDELLGYVGKIWDYSHGDIQLLVFRYVGIVWSLNEDKFPISIN